MERLHVILFTVSIIIQLIRSHAEVTLTGTAFGAGYLQHCTVRLQSMRNATCGGLGHLALPVLD